MAKGNILIIDDEVKMGMILKKALSKDWSNVEAISDSQVGIEYCSKNPVDIMITDLKMPNVDGIEVLKRMKELERELGQLKRMYADMALENRALKDLIEKKL